MIEVYIMYKRLCVYYKLKINMKMNEGVREVIFHELPRFIYRENVRKG